MAAYVDEIMNHELFCLRPDETVSYTLSYFGALEIAAAPVVDARRRPLGFVSLRDLVGQAESGRVADFMTSPADTIGSGSTIRDAALRLAERNRHHLVVVDVEGVVVGYVGSLDVIRGMLGEPVTHPGTFPHYDATNGVVWSDDVALVTANIERAPDGPGLLRLIQGHAGQRDRVVWSEGTRNVRTRLLDLLSTPQPQLGPVADDLESGALRFRTAVTDPDQAFAGMAAAIGLRTL